MIEILFIIMVCLFGIALELTLHTIFINMDLNGTPVLPVLDKITEQAYGNLASLVEYIGYRLENIKYG